MNLEDKKSMLKPREREGITTFWFTTNTSSNKIKCFRKNHKAGVYFVDKRFFRGVSLTGTMEVLETPEAKKEYGRTGIPCITKRASRTLTIVSLSSLR